MLRIALLGLVAASALTAQSPLTTTFANNNGGSVGGGVYFDLTVNVPIQVTSLNLNVTGTGSVEVYTCVGSRLGQQSTPAAWTLVSTGAVTGGVAGAQTPVAITPFVLPTGTNGMAFKAVGVSHNYTNGNGTNQVYSTSELTLSAGEAANTAFAGTPFTPRVVNTSIGYIVAGSGTAASNTTLGAGCYRSYASLYESFAGAWDLNAFSVTFLPSGGGGYVVVPVGSFLPVGSVQATPTVVAIGDDVEQTVPFTTATFPGWTGLTVCSNGFVSKATGNGTGFTPSAAGLLGFSQDCFSLGWHDFNSSIVGGGSIKFEESASVAMVTWDGVWDFGGTSAANASTMQIQFYPNGSVVMSWGVASALGNGFVAGYSPAGASLDPGATDISALTSVTLGTTDVAALSLAASTRPVRGTSWNLDVNNIPVAGTIGLEILGLSDPNISDLFFVGAPGCGIRASLDVVNAWISGGNPTHAYSLSIPINPALTGQVIYSNAAVLVPGVNSLLGGTLTSNGIQGVVGDF